KLLCVEQSQSFNHQRLVQCELSVVCSGDSDMTTATGLSLSEDPRTRRAQLGQNRMTLTRFLLFLLLFPFVSSAQGE
ncbi:hypothetical protein GOODEAATRI_007340, partial [Goodea atripinnis]